MVSSLRQHLVVYSRALWLTLLSGLGVIAGFFFHLLIARVWGADVVGLFGMMSSVLQILLLLVLFGTNRSVVRLVASCVSGGCCRVRLVAIWKLVIPLLIPACVFLYAWASRLANWFSTPDLADYFRIGAVILPFWVVASVWSSAHQGLNRVAVSVLVREVLPVFFAGLFLVFVLFVGLPRHQVMPVWAYWFGTASSAAIGGGLWFCLQPRGESAEVIGSVQSLVRMSSPMLVTSGALLILGWMDTIMLGLYYDSSIVGVYRTALKISILSTIGAQSVRKIAAPHLAKYFVVDDASGFRKWVRFTSVGVFLATLPVIITVMLSARWIMSIFGPAFVTGVPVLYILCLMEGVRSLGGGPGLLLDMTGNQKYFRNATLIAAGMNCVLNMWLVPQYGPNGAAFATALSAFAGLMASNWWVWKQLHVNMTLLGAIRRS